MKPNNINGETRVELLKHMMDRHIECRNNVVRRLDKKIAEKEDKIWKTRKQVSRMEDQLRRLRTRREDAEIRCFKEIKKIHSQISKLTGRPDRDNSDDLD